MIKAIWLVFILFSQVNPLVFAIELTLADAEGMAISHSFELQNLQQSMVVTHLSYQLSVREFLPQITLSFNDTRQVQYNSTDTESIQFGINWVQPIFNGGRSIIQRKLSAIQMSLQSAGLEKQVEEIMDQVWQLYHQVMIHGKKLDLQKELYVLSQSQLNITLKKFELGNITEIDLIESQIEIQSLEIEISTTQNMYLQLSSQFNQLIGLDPKTELSLYPKIDPEYGGIPFEENKKETFYNMALRNNLDLRSAQFELHKAKAQYDIATTSFIPKISLEGTISFAGEQLPLQSPTLSAKINIEFPFEAIPITASVGISSTGTDQYSRNQTYSAPILQNMNFLVSQKSATIQVNQSLEKEQMIRDKLFFTIEQQLLDLKQKRSSLKLNRMAYALQKQKLNILETKNRLGEVKELDLLKGNIEYYNQEIAIWEAILELILAERSLEKTLGLGLGKLQLNRDY